VAEAPIMMLAAMPLIEAMCGSEPARVGRGTDRSDLTHPHAEHEAVQQSNRAGADDGREDDPGRERSAGDREEDPGGDTVADRAEQEAGGDRSEHLRQEDRSRLDTTQPLPGEDRELVRLARLSCGTVRFRPAPAERRRSRTDRASGYHTAQVFEDGRQTACSRAFAPMRPSPRTSRELVWAAASSCDVRLRHLRPDHRGRGCPRRPQAGRRARVDHLDSCSARRARFDINGREEGTNGAGAERFGSYVRSRA
jgi:hypothetical protein